MIIQAVLGLFGGLAVGAAVKECSRGAALDALVGTVGGALSGYFLQVLVGTLVTGGGSMNEPTAVEAAVLQAGAGAVSGACLVMAVGLVRHVLHEHPSDKT
jgi:hypothetical protein